MEHQMKLPLKTQLALENAVAYFILFSIIAVLLVGYALNLFALFNLTSFSGELALRVVGVIIPPLGVILGYV